MRIGKLRHRVAIQAKAEPVPVDATGQSQPSWSTLTTVWASIEPAGGKEFYAGQQVNAEVSHKVTIRYYADLTTAHRLLFGSRIFDINYIRNVDERKVYQELLCKEAV